MIKNYFKIAWRNLIRSWGYSILNIGGLAIGMTGALLLFLWASHEKSYDGFFTKADRTYQLWSQLPVDGKIFSFDQTPELLAPTIRNAIPEIESSTNYMPVGNMAFQVENKTISQVSSFVDSSFFQVFDFVFTQGNVEAFLGQPEGAILTERAAKSLFGSSNALGKTIKVENQQLVTVCAILKDLPPNTEFQFDVLLPRELGRTMNRAFDSWESFDAETYVVLNSKGSAASFSKKIRTFLYPYKTDVHIDLYSLPLAIRHLQNTFEDGKLQGGKIVLVNGFIVTAAFLLLIACINFMNLSTARSEKRAKEVGVRKVTGASRSWLILYFLSEALFMSFISGLIALLLSYICLPYFAQLSGQSLQIPIGNPYFLMAYIGYILLTGLLAGIYPALFLSSFKPVKVLKSVLLVSRSGTSLRKVLVISQFTIAIVLIVTTWVVREQIQYVQHRSAGYDKSKLVYVTMSDLQQQHYASLRHQLLSSGSVSSLSRTYSSLTNPNAMGNGYIWEGFQGTGTSSILFVTIAEEADILKTAGISLLAGRDLDIQKFPTDSSALLVNESAARAMNMKNPIGKWIEKDGYRWQIVGVVKDFVLESPFQKIRPSFITGPIERMNTVHMRLSNQMPLKAALQKIKELFYVYDPSVAFDLHFIDEEYAKHFYEEQKTAQLSLLFAILTIFVSCLGLFGLATFTTEQRTKEIGIRKVLGASIVQITTLLSGSFIRLVLFAFVIASPISYFVAAKWLDNFDYRITISWPIFVLAGLLAIGLTLMTISFQAIKAALANPVDSLRNE